MQFWRNKRDLDGILLLDKPLGMSSNQALQACKRIFGAAKAGHTGSLDPLASGVLPICFGEATKFSGFLLDADKTYRADIVLGTTTSTGDREGEVLENKPVTVSTEQVHTVLPDFLGLIQQIPPMYSALKHAGKPLYQYARAGREIERQPRAVTIHSITEVDFDSPNLSFTVGCSKGTYIRTLAEDIGAALGCGAHLGGLRRVKSAHFALSDAYCIEGLERMSQPEMDMVLLKPEAALEALPKILLASALVTRLRHGQSFFVGLDQATTTDGALHRLYDPEHRFLGLGVLDAKGVLHPKRLLATCDP